MGIFEHKNMTAICHGIMSGLDRSPPPSDQGVAQDLVMALEALLWADPRLWCPRGGPDQDSGLQVLRDGRSKTYSSTMEVSFVCQHCSGPLKQDMSFKILDRVPTQELIAPLKKKTAIDRNKKKSVNS